MFWLVLLIIIIGYSIVNELYKQNQLKKFELLQQNQQQQFELQQQQMLQAQNAVALKEKEDEKLIDLITKYHTKFSKEDLEIGVKLRNELKYLIDDEIISDKDKYSSALAIQKASRKEWDIKYEEYSSKSKELKQKINFAENIEKLRLIEDEIIRKWEKKEQQAFWPNNEEELLKERKRQVAYRILSRNFAKTNEKNEVIPFGESGIFYDFF